MLLLSEWRIPKWRMTVPRCNLQELWEWGEVQMYIYQFRTVDHGRNIGTFNYSCHLYFGSSLKCVNKNHHEKQPKEALICHTILQSYLCEHRNPQPVYQENISGISANQSKVPFTRRWLPDLTDWWSAASNVYSLFLHHSNRMSRFPDKVHPLVQTFLFSYNVKAELATQKTWEHGFRLIPI